MLEGTAARQAYASSSSLPEYMPWDFACFGFSYFVTQSKVVLRNVHYEDMVKGKDLQSRNKYSNNVYDLEVKHRL
jgi:hypothetical protein